jgi:ribosomal protein S18 acetylase RimI-like enzyme
VNDAHPPGARLSARPLRPDEYAAWYRHVTEGYARDIAVNGGTDPAAARRKAEQDMRSVLPLGLETPDHEILVLESDGERVGLLWVGSRVVDGRRVLFVWDVEVDEARRGKGLGRQAMLLAEETARSRGLDRIELNVFGGNAVARSLYRSLGYVERAVSMAKDLSDPGGSR